jgi:hypothetical protein
MNERSQMLGGKNWILPKDMNAYRFFRVPRFSLAGNWKNHLCPSIGPNGGSVATDSVLNTYNIF